MTRGEYLRELRQARGLSLEEVAQAASPLARGICMSAVSKWELGHRDPRASQLAAVLAALGATAGDMAFALGLPWREAA